MIDYKKTYQTKSGLPVRNLHRAGFVNEGEYFENGQWHLGAWLYDGEPYFGFGSTAPKEIREAYTLIEQIEVIESPPAQLDLFSLSS